MSLRDGIRRSVRSVVGATRMGRALEGVDRSDALCLTYDDGPDPVGTREVLEALAERDAKGTFFVMANRVRRHPEVLREVASEGHEIALHGIDHRDLTRCSPRQVRTLTKDALALVEDALGEPVRWFRPPYIGLRADGWLALRGLPVTFVGAGSAIPDWLPELSDAQRLEELRRTLTPGDIVLAHDSFALPEDNAYRTRAPIVDRRRLTREALDLAAARGLRPLTLTGAVASAPSRTAFQVALRRQQPPPELDPDDIDPTRGVAEGSAEAVPDGSDRSEE